MTGFRRPGASPTDPTWQFSRLRDTGSWTHGPGQNPPLSPQQALPRPPCPRLQGGQAGATTGPQGAWQSHLPPRQGRPESGAHKSPERARHLGGQVSPPTTPAQSSLEGTIHPLQRQAHRGPKGTGEAQGHPSGWQQSRTRSKFPHRKLSKQTSQNHKNELHSLQPGSRGCVWVCSHRQPPGAAPYGGAHYPHMATPTENN